MVVNPVFDLLAHLTALACAGGAVSAAAAVGAIEKVLLHFVADVGAKGRRPAAHGAAGVVAGVGVVIAVGVCAHDGHALQVSGGALAGRAG